MILQLNIEDNHKIILSRDAGKALLQDNPVVFKGKAKNLTKALKKASNGSYWLSVVDIKEKMELLLTVKIKNKKLELSWPKREQI